MAYDDYRDYLSGHKDKKVLDIGCGDGGFLLFLKEQGFSDVYGVDNDKDQIAACRERGLREVEAIDDLGKYLKTKQSVYGIIMMKQVMYYFSDEELPRYLASIRSALTEDGTLIVEVFNGAPLTGHYIKDKDYKVKRVFTENSVRAALEDSGFMVVRLCGNRYAGRGIKMLAWVIAHEIWIAFLKCVYILERGLDPYNPKIFSKYVIAFAKKR